MSVITSIDFNSNTFIMKKQYLNFLKKKKFQREHKEKLNIIIDDINNYVSWYVNNNIKNIKNNKVILVDYDNVDLLYLTNLCRFCYEQKILLFIFSQQKIPSIKYFNDSYLITPYKMLYKDYYFKLNINSALKELQTFYKVDIYKI